MVVTTMFKGYIQNILQVFGFVQFAIQTGSFEGVKEIFEFKTLKSL